MPKTIYIPEDAGRSGIDITWTPTSGILTIGGWYDSCVGIQSSSMTLCEFFDKLGITSKDVARQYGLSCKRPKGPQPTTEGDAHPIVGQFAIAGSAPDGVRRMAHSTGYKGVVTNIDGEFITLRFGRASRTYHKSNLSFLQPKP